MPLVDNEAPAFTIFDMTWLLKCNLKSCNLSAVPPLLRGKYWENAKILSPPNSRAWKADPPWGQAQSMQQFAVGCLSSETASTEHVCIVSRSKQALFSHLNSFISLVFPVLRLMILPLWGQVCLHPVEWSHPWARQAKAHLVSVPCVSCCLSIGPQRCADSRKHQLQGLSLNLGLNAFESKFLRKYQVLSGIKLQEISKELSRVLSLTWARREDGTFWDMLIRKPEGQFACPNTGIRRCSGVVEAPVNSRHCSWGTWASLTYTIPWWTTFMPQVIRGGVRHLCLAPNWTLHVHQNGGGYWRNMKYSTPQQGSGEKIFHITLFSASRSSPSWIERLGKPFDALSRM